MLTVSTLACLRKSSVTVVTPKWQARSSLPVGLLRKAPRFVQMFCSSWNICNSRMCLRISSHYRGRIHINLCLSFETHTPLEQTLPVHPLLSPTSWVTAATPVKLRPLTAHMLTLTSPFHFMIQPDILFMFLFGKRRHFVLSKLISSERRIRPTYIIFSRNRNLFFCM